MHSATITTSPVLVCTETIEVRIATTLPEIDAAMRLRFEVFNLEMQKGLQSSWQRGYDTDAYDAYCDHLIARDLETGAIVGTYRLLRQNVAERNIGFYSENEFVLTPLKQAAGRLLELGRSCVAHSHRSAGVIAHLWNAIIEYARRNEVTHLFGCGSLHTTSIDEIQLILSSLQGHHYAPPQYRVIPVSACRMMPDEIKTTAMDEEKARQVLRRLPTILKGYLRAGAWICSEPAFDAEFRTVDLLVLMEMKKLTARYRDHFEAAAHLMQKHSSLNT